MTRILPVFALVLVILPLAQAAEPLTEKAAEAAIVKFGGRVIHDMSVGARGNPVLTVGLDGTDAKTFDAAWLKPFPKLNRLTLAGTKNVDGLLKNLGGLPNIRSLGLDNSDVTEEGLKALAGMKNLADLDLSGVKKPTAKAFAALADCTKLEMLNLAETAIDDEALGKLDTLIALKELKLQSTKVALKALGAFAKWTKLRDLDLSETPLDETALASVAAAKDLEILVIQKSPHKDADLKPLTKLTKLKKLDLAESSKITGIGLAGLEASTGLETLLLNDTAISDDGMKAIAKFESVKMLDLDRTKVTDVGIKLLASPRSLVALSFEETTVGDNGLLTVVDKAKKLEKVGVRKSKVTERGAADAKKKSPRLLVAFD